MVSFIAYCLGVLTGLLVAVVLAKRAHVVAMQTLEKELSNKSWLTRELGETIEAFSKRTVGPSAERELEREWGVARNAGEAWDTYTERVARMHHEQRKVAAQRVSLMPVVMGPVGQA